MRPHFAGVRDADVGCDRGRRRERADRQACSFTAILTQKSMRFWITKNSELPVREQLVRQVLLGILSEDLPSGA